jgi:hypothetical protein
MNFLSRTELLKLTGDTDFSFDGKVRNLRLPQLQDITDRKRGKYTTLEALIMVIANQLSEGNGINQTRAAGMASHAYFINSKMRAIAETSDLTVRGVTPSADIFVTWMLVSEQQEFPRYVAACGTLAQITKKYPSPIQIDTVNVTRCAAVLRLRAAEGDIDVSDLWASTRNHPKSLAVHAYGELLKSASVYAARKVARGQD